MCITFAVTNHSLSWTDPLKPCYSGSKKL